MSKIIDRVKTDSSDERLVRVDESAITVDEGIESYCILTIGTSNDENGAAVYGINILASDQEGKEVCDAEVFVRRALQLMITELESNKDLIKVMNNEKETQEEEPKPN